MVNVSWVSQGILPMAVRGDGERLRPTQRGGMGEGGPRHRWSHLPGGNQWEATRCNSCESSLDKTTSVHAYRSTSLWRAGHGGQRVGVDAEPVGKERERPDCRYPYRPTDGRENLDAGREGTRVLRGGAFNSPRGRAVCLRSGAARTPGTGASDFGWWCAQLLSC